MPTHLLLGSLAPFSSKAERLRWASCLTRGLSSLGSSTSGFRPGSSDSIFWFENIVRSSRQFLSLRSLRGQIFRSTAFLKAFRMAASAWACIMVDLGARADPGVDELLREGDQGVQLLPGLDFRFFAVAGGVRGRVAAEAVGHGVQQHRPVALLEDLLLAGDGVDDGQRVIAVHALGVHLVGVDAGAEAGEDLEAHGLADGLAAHAVEVVDEVDDQRQAAAVGLVPQQLELVHRGEAEAFPHRAAAGRGVADVAMTMPGLWLTCLNRAAPTAMSPEPPTMALLG